MIRPVDETKLRAKLINDVVEALAGVARLEALAMHRPPSIQQRRALLNRRMVLNFSLTDLMDHWPRCDVPWLDDHG